MADDLAEMKAKFNAMKTEHDSLCGRVRRPSAVVGDKLMVKAQVYYNGPIFFNYSSKCYCWYKHFVWQIFHLMVKVFAYQL